MREEIKCGEIPQRVAALLHRNTLHNPFNGLWSGETFPVVGRTPQSADSIPGGLVSTPYQPVDPCKDTLIAALLSE